MRIGFRRKLFLTVFFIVFAVIAVLGFFLSNYLRDTLVDRIVDELTRHADSCRLTVEMSIASSDVETTDALADNLSASIDARVTIVGPGGEVIGDSDLDLKEIRSAPNHGNREEIQEAFKSGFGKSRRLSATLKKDMLYVASSYSKNGHTGVVRVSRSLSAVMKTVSLQFRTLIVAAGLVGLLIALLVSTISSHLLSKTLGTLVDFAKATAEGERRKPIEISSDELGGLAGSINKLSEQIEKHVTTLAEERDRFEAVLNGMNDAVLALDDQQRVTLINSAAIMLLGLGRGPIGKTLLETIRVPELHELVLKTDRERSEEATAEFDLPGKKIRKILARATSRRSGGAVIVLLDVTELRRLENMRRDFVSNVSHELRTPVSIIRANSETLLNGAIKDEKAATRFVTSMLANAERLSNLISDLLDISRIEEGKLELTVEPVQVSLALKRAAAALETHAIEKNFTIQTKSSGELKVLADERALDQILFNFTDNAVKYSSDGGRVILRASEKDGRVRIEVEDNGPGIDPNHRKRLFERFYRIDPGRSREMGGTGLGLAIVKHLASVMNGSVGMEPATPKGSIFWLELAKSA